jgi:N-acetylglucosamine-6-sulfatase
LPARRCRLVGLVALASLLATAAGTPSSASGTDVPAQDVPSADRAAKRNIVVIMTDDQTAESLRVMPHVRSLLQDEGVTFTNSFVSYPLCCPSRATYNTGQYAHNHHVTYNNGSTGGYHAFFGKRTTVPVALQRAGYRTIHIGKYLNGYGRARSTLVPPGWTDWAGSVDPSTYEYYDFILNENGRLHQYRPDQYQTDVYTQLAVDRIDREARRPGPFFLDLAYLAPHAVKRETSGLDAEDLEAAGAPHSRHGIRYPVPAPRDTGRFLHAQLPDRRAFNEGDVTDKPQNIRGRPLFDATERIDIERDYRVRLQSLLAVDRGVKRVVDALDATGQLDDTVIVFTSDNGFFHGEHRVPYGKYLPYEPSIRVPLVVRGPDVESDATSDALVSNVDVPATIIDLASAHPLRRLDGRSLAPLLSDPEAHGPHDEVLLESGANDAGAPVYQGLRTQRYLYAEYDTGERELYDLRADPQELRNLAGRQRVHGVQARLAARLAKVRACTGMACP